MNSPSIYSYIKTQESLYDTREITVGENWEWSFKNHVQMIFHFKNSQFMTGSNDLMNIQRTFKNIMEPVLNLSYWAQDIEVKDVTFYIESENGRILSFLIKKYHDEVYVKENNLDTLFDEITEDDVDYGGVLVQKGKDRPEVVFLPSIAFCDQTDILGGPAGFKFSFSPDKLRQMKSKGWGEESNGASISIEDLVILAQHEKSPTGDSSQKKNDTTGKNIEVYIVRGSLPEHYLKDNDNMELWYNQIHVVGFYTNKEGKKEGVTLYRKKEKDGNLKFHTSKKIQGRALGRGVGEGLLHPQIWTNFLEIHKTKMLEAGSKVPLYTDDPNFTNRQEIQDMENLEVLQTSTGSSINQVPTVSPANIQLFEQSINTWFEQAQTVGSAFDPILGKEAVSGTTFRGQERTIQQGRGLHDRRRGQRAKFLEEIYRDWIIPDMVKKILDGKKFLATLTSNEMQYVTDKIVKNRTQKKLAELMFEGELVTPELEEEIKTSIAEDFTNEGNVKLIEILKDEFKDVEVKMGINIAGKQKNLSLLTDKILSVFQFIFSNPQGFQQVIQIPGMQKAFNDILEFSGISEVDFSAFVSSPMAQPQPAQGVENSPLALSEPV